MKKAPVSMRILLMPLISPVEMKVPRQADSASASSERCWLGLRAGCAIAVDPQHGLTRAEFRSVIVFSCGSDRDRLLTISNRPKQRSFPKLPGAVASPITAFLLKPSARVCRRTRIGFLIFAADACLSSSLATPLHGKRHRRTYLPAVPFKPQVR